MRWVVISILRLYQVTLSQVIPPSCRFTPTCSSYSIEAIGRYGLFQGGWLTVKRLLRCHPGHPGGFDPVPDIQNSRCNSCDTNA